MKFFSLTNSEQLAKKLNKNLSKISIKKFSDGEIKVELLESVRGKKVVIIGSLRSSDDIMELLIAGDAARRASAKEIIALVPYLSYMRQDRKDVPRTSIGAKLIANMIETAGYNQLITLDLHANQIEGFFNIPVTHVEGRSIFVPFIRNNIGLQDTIIVSPDVGGAKRAKKYSRDLDIPLAIINKEREMANEVSSMELIGDVSGKKVILVDDMVDTGGSLVKAADTLLENGATEVLACITHGVLSNDARNKIYESNIKKLYITDSIEFSDDDFIIDNISKIRFNYGDKIEYVTCSDILNKTLSAIKDKRSIEATMKSVIQN
jgi:ribose-phosphate pyrophosphokinase